MIPRARIPVRISCPYGVGVLLALGLLLACGSSGVSRSSVPAGTPTTASATSAAVHASTPALARISTRIPSPLPARPTGAAPVYGYRVVNSYPHDLRAFTQGLVYRDGFLYEGTGNYGESTLRRVDLETGEVQQQTSLPDEHFGEGIAILGQRIFQLTWQSGICLVYDPASFELLDQFTYDTEGWGLTTDGQQLIMSDGTATLSFRDPNTFAVLGTIIVHDDGVPIEQLNELEYIDGEVWANVWKTDRIARIDPATGRIVAWLDLTGLYPESQRDGSGQDVLNGIAHDPATDRIFVTGKYWPRLFEVRSEE
jgi:glutamine cyclotransferase